MDPQTRRKLLIAPPLFALTLLLGALCALQYVTYEREGRTLNAAIRWVSHQIGRAEAMEREPGRLAAALKDVEHRLSRLRLQVPEALDVEGFVDHFSAMAGRFDVKVKKGRVDPSSHSFYDQAELSLSLVGDDKAIRALLEELGARERLTRYRMLQCADGECNVKISIFSVPPQEKEAPNVFDIQACAECNSKVWLWPFTRKIQERYEELRSLCEERQRRAETIQSTEELTRKLRLTRFMEEVVKHLAKAEASPQAN